MNSKRTLSRIHYAMSNQQFFFFCKLMSTAIFAISDIFSIATVTSRRVVVFYPSMDFFMQSGVHGVKFALLKIESIK